MSIKTVVRGNNVRNAFCKAVPQCGRGQSIKPKYGYDAIYKCRKLGDEDFTYVEMNHDDVEFMENNMNTSFHQNTKMPPWFNIDDDDVTVKMIQKENARLKKHKAYVKKKNQAQKRPKKTNFNDFKNGLCVSIKPKSRNPSQRFRCYQHGQFPINHTFNGSDLKKAEKYGAKIIYKNEFLKMYDKDELKILTSRDAKCVLQKYDFQKGNQWKCNLFPFSKKMYINTHTPYWINHGVTFLENDGKTLYDF
mmetsp:Transcript_11317/g.18326  ORF Transcript_11317/g.18326 Transcript_11317/m.18326 type:complete len:249 (+) Transcript_11317:465-1211(+)